MTSSSSSDRATVPEGAARGPNAAAANGDGVVMTEAPWDHKDAWRKRGQDFMVEVTRHNGTEDISEGPHRWAVYAYIYPKHPHFAEFDGPHMWQLAATCLPLHGYPSYLEYPMYEGKVTSVKVGADYHHLHDYHFTHYATPNEAREVFDDAQALFDWLQAAAHPVNASGAMTDDSDGTSYARSAASPVAPPNDKEGCA
jgi:hypothetical protein